MTKNKQVRCVPRFIQCFLNYQAGVCSDQLKFCPFLRPISPYKYCTAEHKINAHADSDTDNSKVQPKSEQS